VNLRFVSVNEEKALQVTEWWSSNAFNATERSHLAFTEQFLVSVSDTTPQQVSAPA